jgi:hypothetical protein
MKKIVLLLFTSHFAFAQTQNKKVKIVLLGTFHFGATTVEAQPNLKNYSLKKVKQN